MKHMLPAIPTTATSLQIKKEGEFDHLLLLVFGCFLAGLNIPSAFLKSSAPHRGLSFSKYLLKTLAGSGRVSKSLRLNRIFVRLWFKTMARW